MKEASDLEAGQAGSYEQRAERKQITKKETERIKCLILG